MVVSAEDVAATDDVVVSAVDVVAADDVVVSAADVAAVAVDNDEGCLVVADSLQLVLSMKEPETTS